MKPLVTLAALLVCMSGLCYGFPSNSSSCIAHHGEVYVKVAYDIEEFYLLANTEDPEQEIECCLVATLEECSSLCSANCTCVGFHFDNVCYYEEGSYPCQLYGDPTITVEHQNVYTRVSASGYSLSAGFYIHRHAPYDSAYMLVSDGVVIPYADVDDFVTGATGTTLLLKGLFDRMEHVPMAMYARPFIDNLGQYNVFSFAEDKVWKYYDVQLPMPLQSPSVGDAPSVFYNDTMPTDVDAALYWPLCSDDMLTTCVWPAYYVYLFSGTTVWHYQMDTFMSYSLVNSYEYPGNAEGPFRNLQPGFDDVIKVQGEDAIVVLRNMTYSIYSTVTHITTEPQEINVCRNVE